MDLLRSSSEPDWCSGRPIAARSSPPHCPAGPAARPVRGQDPQPASPTVPPCPSPCGRWRALTSARWRRRSGPPAAWGGTGGAVGGVPRRSQPTAGCAADRSRPAAAHPRLVQISERLGALRPLVRLQVLGQPVVVGELLPLVLACLLPPLSASRTFSLAPPREPSSPRGPSETASAQQA